MPAINTEIPGKVTRITLHTPKIDTAMKLLVVLLQRTPLRPPFSYFLNSQNSEAASAALQAAAMLTRPAVSRSRSKSLSQG